MKTTSKLDKLNGMEMKTKKKNPQVYWYELENQCTNADYSIDKQSSVVIKVTVF